MKRMMLRFNLITAILIFICVGTAANTMAEGGCPGVIDWSPNGAYVAYIGPDVVIVAETSEFDAPVPVSVSWSMFPFNLFYRFSCIPYVWSPDSEQLLTYRGENSTLINVTYGNWSIFGKDPYTGVQSRFYQWAADGAEVYFGTDQDGDMEIYASEVNGANRRQLTDNQANDSFIGLSPDESNIFFVSDQEGQNDLYVMDRDGTNVRRLSNDVDPLRREQPDPPRFWRWSPDHAHIAFGWGDETSTYYVMNADGSNLLYVQQGWLSPDWSQIAKRTSGGGLVITNLDGSNSRTLSLQRVNELFWLPNGRQLVVTSGAGDIAEAIFVGNDDGTDLRQIADNASVLRMSPVGDYLAFERGGEDGGKDIFVLNIEDGNLLNLTQDWQMDYYGLEAWSPDAEKLLIRGWGNFIMVNRDGRDVVDLTSLANCPDATSSYYGSWDWSPDGIELAYIVRCSEGNTLDIMVAAANGSNPRTLVEIVDRDQEIREVRPLQEARGRIEDAIASGATELSLSGLSLKILPLEIVTLTGLHSLDLSNNQLTALPPEIGLLSGLESLDLSDNLLKTLPAEIGQLTSLQSLDLSFNSLTSIPSEVGDLISLRGLDLRRNYLTALPLEISQLISLTALNLGNNPLISPPVEVIGLGVEAIRAYLENQSD